MNINVGRLAWELSVLQRAVAFPNLSLASQQIGISQPQLSRILQRTEKALGITLLDRRIKRAPKWTPEAHKIAEAFREASAHLEKRIRSVGTESQTIDQVNIATLEGMAPYALQIAESILKNQWARTVHLDVQDLKELNISFEAGLYDIIINFQRGGKRKNALERHIGYQVLEFKQTHKNPSYLLLSRAEALMKHNSDFQGPRLVSNSLAVKRLAFERFQAAATFPSALYAKSKGGKVSELEILLMVRDYISGPIMEYLEKYTPKF